MCFCAAGLTSRSLLHSALQPAEVLARVVESVGMIDAQAVHLAFVQQALDESMSFSENLSILLPESSKVVHVEKAAVVDVIGSDTPVGEPERLRLDKLVELL